MPAKSAVVVRALVTNTPATPSSMEVLRSRAVTE